jgi:hypothetical protein
VTPSASAPCATPLVGANGYVLFDNSDAPDLIEYGYPNYYYNPADYSQYWCNEAFPDVNPDNKIPFYDGSPKARALFEMPRLTIDSFLSRLYLSTRCLPTP